MTTVYDKLYEIFSQRKFKKIDLQINKYKVYDFYSLDMMFHRFSRNIDYNEFIKEYGDYLFRKWKTLSARRFNQHCLNVLYNIRHYSCYVKNYFIDVEPIDIEPIDLTKALGEIFTMRVKYGE